MKSFSHFITELNEGTNNAQFTGHLAELFTARLKYRLASGGISFHYELDRPERVVETAFAEYTNQVREKGGYTVLIGTPG